MLGSRPGSHTSLPVSTTSTKAPGPLTRLPQRKKQNAPVTPAFVCVPAVLFQQRGDNPSSPCCWLTSQASLAGVQGACPGPAHPLPGNKAPSQAPFLLQPPFPRPAARRGDPPHPRTSPPPRLPGVAPGPSTGPAPPGPPSPARPRRLSWGRAVLGAPQHEPGASLPRPLPGEAAPLRTHRAGGRRRPRCSAGPRREGPEAARAPAGRRPPPSLPFPGSSPAAPRPLLAYRPPPSPRSFPAGLPLPDPLPARRRAEPRAAWSTRGRRGVVRPVAMAAAASGGRGQRGQHGRPGPAAGPAAGAAGGVFPQEQVPGGPGCEMAALPQK